MGNSAISRRFVVEPIGSLWAVVDQDRGRSVCYRSRTKLGARSVANIWNVAWNARPLEGRKREGRARVGAQGSEAANTNEGGAR